MDLDLSNQDVLTRLTKEATLKEGKYWQRAETRDTCGATHLKDQIWRISLKDLRSPRDNKFHVVLWMTFVSNGVGAVVILFPSQAMIACHFDSSAKAGIGPAATSAL